MADAAKTKYDRELEHIAGVCDDVERILKMLSESDAATIKAALELLDEHKQTRTYLKIA